MEAHMHTIHNNKHRDDMHTSTHGGTQTPQHKKLPTWTELGLKITAVTLAKAQSGGGSTQQMEAAERIIELRGSESGKKKKNVQA